jgi:hypothetical protein
MLLPFFSITEIRCNSTTLLEPGQPVGSGKTSPLPTVKSGGAVAALLGILSFIALLTIGFGVLTRRLSVDSALAIVGGLAVFLMVSPILFSFIRAAIPFLLLCIVAVIALAIGVRIVRSVLE